MKAAAPPHTVRLPCAVATRRGKPREGPSRWARRPQSGRVVPIGRPRHGSSLGGRTASTPDGYECSIGWHANFQRTSGHLPCDDETAVDVDPVVNASVDPRLTRLAAHRGVAASLIRKHGIQDQAVGPRDTGVVAWI